MSFARRLRVSVCVLTVAAASLIAARGIRTAPPPLRTTNAQTAGTAGVSLDGSLSQTALLRGTSQDLFAILRLSAARSRADDAERAPVDVAVVIDRSGSMNSRDKLAYARAGAALFARSLGPADRIAVVTYDQTVTVPVPLTAAGDLEAVAAAIEQLTPGGATNLAAGLQTGVMQLRHSPRDGALARVVLLTDGLANTGVTEPRAIATIARDAAAAGITVSTLGLGADYNEDLLQQLAEAGRGHYYFLETPHQMADVFAQELGRLVRTVATSPQLVLLPGPGTEVVEVLGHATTASDRGVTVPLAALVAGEERSVVAHLKTAATHPDSLLRAELRFADPEGVPHALRLALHAEITDDRSVAQASIEPEAAAAATDVAAAQILIRAMDAYAAGRQEEARGLLETEIDSLSRSARTYNAPQLRSRAHDYRSTLDALAATPPAAEEGRLLTKERKAEAWQRLGH